MYDLVEAARARVAGLPCRVVGYGHLGDGNLHLNVSAPAYDGAVLERLEPWVYEWTAARRGSVSAEHGLGRMKAECIGRAPAAPAGSRARSAGCAGGAAARAALAPARRAGAC
jgi:D-2-hydroxyglutarate dehydrogenase